MTDHLVSIVILNWNGKAFLERFLPVLVDCTLQSSVELVVADNGSTDGSLSWLSETWPQVRRISFEKNFGFTGGYNRALALCDSKYYVLLNSDVEVTPGWLAPLLNFMELHPEAGACMPAILSYDRRSHFEYAGAAGGYMDRYGYPFCRGRILSEIEEDRGQYDASSQVFWASGACMMVRASLWRQLGGLDELFFAHMEEIDFCWRLQNAGYQVWVLPESRIYHVGGGTLPNDSPRKLFFNYRNSLYMLHKNLPSGAFLYVLLIRTFFDLGSAVVYLLQAKPSFCAAVFKAYAGFFRNRRRLKKSGNRKYSHELAGLYRHSIVLNFFLLRKKKFSVLAPAEFCYRGK